MGARSGFFGSAFFWLRSSDLRASDPLSWIESISFYLNVGAFGMGTHENSGRGPGVGI